MRSTLYLNVRTFGFYLLYRILLVGVYSLLPSSRYVPHGNNLGYVNSMSLNVLYWIISSAGSIPLVLLLIKEKFRILEFTIYNILLFGIECFVVLQLMNFSLYHFLGYQHSNFPFEDGVGLFYLLSFPIIVLNAFFFSSIYIFRKEMIPFSWYAMGRILLIGLYVVLPFSKYNPAGSNLGFGDSDSMGLNVIYWLISAGLSLPLGMSVPKEQFRFWRYSGYILLLIILEQFIFMFLYFTLHQYLAFPFSYDGFFAWLLLVIPCMVLICIVFSVIYIFKKTACSYDHSEYKEQNL